MVIELLMMFIFTTKEVINTARRPFTLEGGMRKEIHDMRTLMPAERALTAAAVLTMLTVLMSTGVP